MLLILYTAGMCEFPLGEIHTRILTGISHTGGQHHIKALNLIGGELTELLPRPEIHFQTDEHLELFFSFSGVSIFGINIIFTSLPNESGLIGR